MSVGIVRGQAMLDLDYSEDSEAETDMNVVMNNGGAFIEVQGTAEGHAFRRHELDALLKRLNPDDTALVALAVGVDAGITSWVALSTGEKVTNPRHERRDRRAGTPPR